MSDGIVGGAPRVILRIEGAVLLVCATAAYAWSGQAWWGFAVLLFAPDVSMLSYIAGPGPGAIVYNAVHTVTPPLIGLCAAVMPGQTVRAGLALIWLAHIGRDRMLGFGDTHLSAPARARMTATTPR